MPCTSVTTGDGPVGRGFAAVADQGFVSLANFSVHILLGRWLAEAEYGAFASSFAVFVMFQMVHAAILIEPMLVYGNRTRVGRLVSYRRVLVRFHYLVSIAFSVVCAVAFAWFRLRGQGSLADASLGAGVAAFAVLLFYLFRRICYVTGRVSLAARGGAVYLVAVTTGLFVLGALSQISILSAYLLLSVGALLGASAIIVSLPGRDEQEREPDFQKSVLSEHVRYGRWAIGSAALVWFPPNVYYLILPYFADLSTTGALRAMMNGFTPVLQANIAVATALLPHLAAQGDRGRLETMIRSFNRRLILATLAYSALILTLGPALISLAYGGRYTGDTGTLWILAAMPLVSGLALGWRTALQAVERPDVVFRANGVSAVVAVVVGALLTRQFGLPGAAATMVLSYTVLWLVSLAGWHGLGVNEPVSSTNV